jgi:hypothetical protein
MRGLNETTPISRPQFGGPTIPIVDDGPLDTNVIDPGVITVDTQSLNLLLVNFRFSDLGSESNGLIGTPFYFPVARRISCSRVTRLDFRVRPCRNPSRRILSLGPCGRLLFRANNNWRLTTNNSKGLCRKTTGGSE